MIYEDLSHGSPSRIMYLEGMARIKDIQLLHNPTSSGSYNV